MNPPSPTGQVPPHLLWLHDAPLFMDDEHVERFYDAVVRPLGKNGLTTVQISEANASELKSKLKMDASVTTEKLAWLVLPVLALFKPEFKMSGEMADGSSSSRTESSSFQFVPIDNPGRQLEQLALHYLFNHPGRLFLPDSPATSDWREPAVISAVPRAMVFLDLPGLAESIQRAVPPTRIIPTAAEFSNGEIVQIYRELEFAEGVPPPDYPDSKVPPQELTDARRKYWAWFDQHFSATKAMIAVEKAATKDRGKISWIDFRIPITSAGDTLHLHICPRGKCDTGTFAYNFIKRGYKHGIRIVGTVKSEPDVNVLALYEK